eukprot:Skav234945  [mRNA]  locus=scaffold2817:42584:45066:- [translate_table: standard]
MRDGAPISTNMIAVTEGPVNCHALELQQRHEELRQDRQAELQLVAQDFERRLEELRGSLRREADHARAAAPGRAMGGALGPPWGGRGGAGWVEVVDGRDDLAVVVSSCPCLAKMAVSEATSGMRAGRSAAYLVGLSTAETSSQQMAALQRRHERMQRLEHDFAEERRMREANKGATAGFAAGDWLMMVSQQRYVGCLMG